jgi:hypothetical protein
VILGWYLPWHPMFDQTNWQVLIRNWNPSELTLRFTHPNILFQFRKIGKGDIRCCCVWSLLCWLPTQCPSADNRGLFSNPDCHSERNSACCFTSRCSNNTELLFFQWQQTRAGGQWRTKHGRRSRQKPLPNG